MRSKAVIVFVTLLAITFLAGSAFAQIQWNPNDNGAALSVTTPGKLTNATLRVYIDANAELTYNQTLSIHIGDFIVLSTTAAETESNYSFSSPEGSLNMDNDGSDFEVAYSETDSTLTITLGEFALVPGDSLTIGINNFLINKGDNGSSTAAFNFKVKSYDQPLWSTDTDSDNDLAAPSDQRIGVVAIGDSIAGNSTYIWLTDTAEGYIPKQGKLKVILPAGFTYAATDSVLVRDDGALVTVDNANIVTSTRSITIPLNASADIADGSLLEIFLGDTSEVQGVVNNASIYTGTSADTSQQRTFTSGLTAAQALTGADKYQFTIIGMDYDADTLFYGKSAGAGDDVTFEVVSNWFPVSTANSGWGGTLVGDNTAGNLTAIDIWFMTSTNVDSVNWVQFDLSAFDVVYSQAIDSTNFTLTGGNLTSGTFHTDTVSGSPTTIRITPQLGQGVALPPHTQIKLTIASGVLQNKGAVSDFTVSMSTADQSTAIDDRDTDQILPNTGGIISVFDLADSAASQPSAIDTLKFTTNGWIDSTSYIKITFPSQFTLIGTGIDSVTVWWDSAGTSWPNGEPYHDRQLADNEIEALTTANGTVTNTEFILKMHGRGDIPAGSNVYIAIGDTSGYHSAVGAAANTGSVYNAAFYNPSASYAGVYPTAGTYSPITITVTDANSSVYLQGSNTNAPVGISSNSWGAAGNVIGTTVYSGYDSTAYFGQRAGAAAVTAKSYTGVAGDSTALTLWFTVGEQLIRQDPTSSATDRADTLFFDLGNYFQVDYADTADGNFAVVGGVEGGGSFNFRAGYDLNQNALYIVPLIGDAVANNDTMFADSLVVLTINYTGANANTFGGFLFNDGQRSGDIRPSMWTNRQRTAVQMDSTHLSVGVAGDTLTGLLNVFKEDSVAGETSSDSITFAMDKILLQPGSYMTIGLDRGMTFVNSAWDASKITIHRDLGSGGGGGGADITSSFYTVTRVANDSLKIVWGAGDTVGTNASADTLSIIFGDGTTDLINNSIPDSISGRRDSLRTEYPPYVIRWFDSGDRLVKDFGGDATAAGSGATVSNVFFDTLYTRSTSGTTTSADTAGSGIDSLFIPFKVGKYLISGNALQLTFHGAMYTSTTTAEDESNYKFYGDSTGSLAFTTTASSDSILTFTFSAGTLGYGGGATNSPLNAFESTIMIGNNVLSYLGYDGSDGLDVDLVTVGVQTTAVSDTTTVILQQGGTLTQDLNAANVTEGLDDLEAGATAVSWAGGYDPSTFHGTVFKDGQIRLKFLVSNDSTKVHGATSEGLGVYGYDFGASSTSALTDPDSAGVADLTFTNSANAGTGGFSVIGKNGATPVTLTISGVAYDLLESTASTVYYDTAMFTIQLADGSNSIGSHDSLVVMFNNKIDNPTEASADEQVAPGGVTGFYSETATASLYNVVMEVYDRRGYKISTGVTPTTWNDISAGEESQFLVIVEGQQHDPGGMDTGGTVGGTTTIAATDDSTHFMVATVDAYYNIIDAANANPNVDINLKIYSGTDEDNSYKSEIFDALSGTGVMRITNAKNGVVRYTTGDSLKIHKAGDNNSDLGRSYFKTIEASLAASRTPTITTKSSDNFKVTHGAYSRVAVMLPGQTLLEGDSTNVKDPDPVTDPPDLSAGGTYSVSVYPVDIYYNRVDSSSQGTDHLTLAATNGTLSASTAEYAATYVSTFSLVADQGTGAGTVTVTDTSLSKSGAATFTVIASTIEAVFASFQDTTDVAGATYSYSVSLRYSGTFPTNNAWTIWLSADSGATQMDDVTYGGLAMNDNVHTGEGSGTLVQTTLTCTLKTVAEGEWYLFATIPSIDNTVIGKTDTAFVLLHQPIVDTVTTPIVPVASGTITLNSGASPATTTQSISFAVRDYDDADVPVWMFLNTRDDGVKADFDASAETFIINAGESTENTSLLVSPLTTETGSLDKYDTSYTMYIDTALHGSTSYIAAGDYYVYIVTKDPSGDINTARSSDYLTIKHSPTITLDKPVLGVSRINTADTRSLTVGWSSGGDIDIDDNATIKLYLDTVETWEDSSLAAAKMATGSTAVDITASVTVNEDSDGGYNDLYTWDLTSFTTADLPVDGYEYFAYAVIYDGRDSVVSKSPGSVVFTHDPDVNFAFNFGTGITKAGGLNKASAVTQITVNNGEIFRLAFDANDLDDDQYIRFVVSQKDTTGVGYQTDFNWGVDGWVMNSSNGNPTTGVVTSVTTDDSYFNWYSENMTGMTGTGFNGDYYVYAFITKDGTDANWIDSNIKKYVARGKVKLTGRESSVTDWDLRVAPSLVSVSEGDTVECTLMLDSQGEELEVFAAYLDIDTTLFSVVNLTAPFADSGSNYFFGLQTAIQDTGWYESGYYKLNLVKQYTSGGTATDSAVATFKLISKGTDLSGTETGNVYFGVAPRNSRTIHNGVEKVISAPSPAIGVMSNPAATILGLVPLEKRTNHSKVITFELRKPGQEVPYLPTAFVNANDTDPTTSGIQITTASDGQYVLTDIPTGQYYLVAKAESYITGQYPSIDVVAGDALQGIHPTYNNDASPIDYGELKGGDVSSYSSAGSQDNLVNTYDISYITTNWGLTGVDIGDIDGDGSIGFSDFSIASANQGLRGIPPRYNKTSISNKDAKIKLEGVPEIVQSGEEFTVEVWANNVSDLFAYIYEVRFDAGKLEFVDEGVSEGDMLPSRPGETQTFFFTKQREKGTLVASAISGRSDDVVSGNGVIARMTFRALTGEDTPDIQLHNVRLANSNSDVDRMGDVALLPDEFGLADNYPNPFNPVTRIRFQLPMASHVTLKIYNILGQEVATLVNRDMTAGFKYIRWNGTNNFGKRVASGVYIYRIEAGNFKMSKKMTLIK